MDCDWKLKQNQNYKYLRRMVMEYVGREEHAEFAKRIDDEQHRQNKRIVVMCLIQIKR